MTGAEFDKYAPDYSAMHQSSVAFSGCEIAYFADYKIVRASQVFKQNCGASDRLLDFGCGTGASVPYFNRYIPGTIPICADVSTHSLTIAEQRFPGMAQYLPIEGERLALDDASVGMCFSSCVFHHIPSGQHAAWLSELRRVVRPGGPLLIFEHNPLNPLTRHAVDRCEFDKDAILLRAGTLKAALQASGWRCREIRYHVFFPGFLKQLRPMESLLGWLPLGGQYSVLAIRS